MKKNLIQEIKTLENLPNSIKEINNFRKNDNSDVSALVKILKKDSLIVSNILKRDAKASLFLFISYSY